MCAGSSRCRKDNRHTFNSCHQLLSRHTNCYEIPYLTSPLPPTIPKIPPRYTIRFRPPKSPRPMPCIRRPILCHILRSRSPPGARIRLIQQPLIQAFRGINTLAEMSTSLGMYGEPIPAHVTIGLVVLEEVGGSAAWTFCVNWHFDLVCFWGWLGMHFRDERKRGERSEG